MQHDIVSWPSQADPQYYNIIATVLSAAMTNWPRCSLRGGRTDRTWRVTVVYFGCDPVEFLIILSCSIVSYAGQSGVGRVWCGKWTRVDPHNYKYNVLCFTFISKEFRWSLPYRSPHQWCSCYTCPLSGFIYKMIINYSVTYYICMCVCVNIIYY